MKKIFNLAVAFIFATVAISMVGCSKDNTVTDPDVAKEATAVVTNLGTAEEGYEASSATFAIEVEGVESYTYLLHKGGCTTPSDGVLVYAEADEILPIEADGEILRTVYGLEGGSSYTVEFVFKVAGEENYISQLVDAETADYENLLNIISVDKMEYSFQVNFPEDKYYRMATYTASEYEYVKTGLGDYLNYTDKDVILHLGDDEVFQGANVHTIKDGHVIKNAFYGDLGIRVRPAMSFFILIAECRANGELITGGASSVISSDPAESAQTRVSGKPSIGAYYSSCTDTKNRLTGLYARQNVTTPLPAKAKGDVDVDIHLTERSATFLFTPSEEVTQYGYTFLPNNQADAINAMPEGEDKEVYLTSLMKEMQPCYEAVQDGFINMEIGTYYTLVVIYQSDELGFERGVKAIAFTAIESQLPVIELEITPTPVPDNSPYKVGFTVKAPNKDCQHIKYLCNYTSEWHSLIYSDLYSGYDMDKIMGEMINSYGTSLTTSMYPDFFAGVNSDEGYYMEFPTWENSETTLAIATYNQDEKINVVSCAAMSLEEPLDAEVRVESPLFESLLGDWTGRMPKYQYGWEVNNATPTFYDKSYDAKIINDPASDAPDTFDANHPSYAGVLAHYVNLAIQDGYTGAKATEVGKAELDEQFRIFKETAAKYVKKYRGHNRLCLVGCDLILAYTEDGATPWDLFLDLNYSAWNVEQMFVDYGPKMFLEVKEDGSVAVVTDRQFIAPFMACGQLNYFLAGISKNGASSCLDQEFPLSFSDDDNFTIDPIKVGDYDDFYLSVCYERGGVVASMLASAPFEFSRQGSTVAPQPRAMASRSAKAGLNPVTTANVGHTYRRPYMPKNPAMVKSLTVAPKDINDYLVK